MPFGKLNAMALADKAICFIGATATESLSINLFLTLMAESLFD